MRNLIQSITITFSLLLAFSCNNDFLKEETGLVNNNSSTIVISPDWEATDYNIYFPNAGNAKFTVAHAPAWLKITSSSGQFINDYALLKCKASVYRDFSEVGIYHTFITLSVEGKGNVNIPIAYITEGNPVIETPNSMTFSCNSLTERLSVKNTGKGILIWDIVELPYWLLLNDNGWTYRPPNILPQNETGYVYLSYNSDLPYQEKLSGKIVIISNDKNKPVTEVEVEMDWGNPNNVKSLEGNITGACIDRQSDILYLTTKQPNRFVAYDIQNKTIARELSLNYAPTCFSISEDGSKTVIGHDGYITSIDMDNFSTSKIVEVNHTIYNIEWGKDNWCCYSEPNVQWSYLYWVNLNTNETVYYDNIYESCILRKIPNQNYILGTESILSAGVYIFDIDTRKREFKNISFIGSFSFSDDGAYMYSIGSPGFSDGGSIYKTSSFFVDYYAYIALPIGQFTPAPNRIHWIDHYAASHSVWIISSSSNNYFDEQCEIIQYDDNDYTRKTTYHYNKYQNCRLVQAHYVFANKAGTELVVIRNATDGEAMWSLEFIPVTK